MSDSHTIWKSSMVKIVEFAAVVLAGAAVSSMLAIHFRTTSALIVNSIPIILCGWFFGRMYPYYAAVSLLVANTTVFRFSDMAVAADSRLPFLGIMGAAIFATVGFTLGTLKELLVKIRQLNHEIESKNRELQKVVFHDPLTELHNRRYVSEFLVGQVSIFLRQLTTPEFAMRNLGVEEKVLFLMVVDIDHFKKINDSRGHGVGDEVLAQVASRIRDAVRFDDVVVRWGGEEFLIVCPMVERKAAELVMSKVLDGVRSTPVLPSDGAEIWVTISMGAIWMPVFRRHPCHVSFDKAILIADKALYDAKANGRDHGRLIVTREDAVTTHDGVPPDGSDEFYKDPACCDIRIVGV